MKQVVVNKYNRVYTMVGTTSMGVYSSIKEFLDAMSKLYERTLYESRTYDVKVYGVIEEGNGYEHTSKDPIFTTNTRCFWNGEQPSIKEVKKIL